MARYMEQWESYRDATVVGIRDTEKGWSIPLANGNRHYRMYLDWVAEGNVADPAYTFAERQAMAIAGPGGILATKLQADISYDGDTIKADKEAKADLTFRAYADGKAKDIKIKKLDGKLKLIDKNAIDTVLQLISARDEAAIDAYDIAIAAIEAAVDWAGVETAIAAFEAV